MLLVDDNSATNFLNRKIIETTDLVSHINVATNGMEALDCITKKGQYANEKCTKANIIFLDINMPQMDGYEFLEHYRNLDDALKAEIIVVFLTTSNWHKDKEKTRNNDLIFEYIEKPLSKKKFIEIYDYYIGITQH